MRLDTLTVNTIGLLYWHLGYPGVCVCDSAVLVCKAKLEALGGLKGMRKDMQHLMLDQVLRKT